MSDDEPIGRRGAAPGDGVFAIPGSGGRIVVRPEPGRAIGDAIVVAVGPRPVTVVRPADLLVLTFSFTNLRFKSGSSRPALLERRVKTRPAFLTVEFPSQHVVEKAYFEAAAGIAVKAPPPPAGDNDPDHVPQEPDVTTGSEPADPPPIRALLAGPSRLVFRVTAEEIAYTLEGLLAACTYLRLSVAPHALPAPRRRGVAVSVADLIASKDVNVKAAVAAPTGRSAAARRAARFAGVGNIAAVSRSLTAAGRLQHRFGAEQALIASAQLSIGDQLGLGRFVDDLVAAGVIRIKPIPRPPTDTETGLELPWRLILSPCTDGGFAHRTDAAPQAGRVELWHSRLGVRVTAPKGVRVDEELTAQRIVRAIWTRDHDRFPYDPPPNEPQVFGQASGDGDVPEFRKSLNSRDRILIVHETSNFGLLRNGQAWTPPPVSVDRLMLTSLGGWLSSDVQIPALPDGPFSLQQWKHRATMGRDHEVKVVYAGFLYPFGHKASLVKVTERKFVPGAPGNPAYLFQRMFIIVREPMRTFKDGRTDATTRQRLDLAMPLKTIAFVTRVTPDLDVPQPIATAPHGAFVFFPAVDGSPFLFKLVGVDVEGNVVEYGGPLLFVERPWNEQGGANKLGEVRNSYLAAADQFRRHDLRGQRLAFAASEAIDDTTLSAEALYWDAVTPDFLDGPQDDPRFAPVLRTARVVVPAMSALAGSSGSTEVKYLAHYAEHGFAGNSAELFLETTQKPKLDFTGRGDRSGGLVTPNLEVRSLSRRRGPVGGDPAKVLDGSLQPADFFAGIKAKLFGIVPLPDLLEALGFDPSKFPTFASQSLNRITALMQDLQRLGQRATALAAEYAGTGDAQVDAVLAALDQVAADGSAVIGAVGDLLDDPDTAPTAITSSLTALAGSIGALGGTIGAATLLPAAVRNDVGGLVRRVQEQVGQAAQVAAAVAELVDAVQQFVRGLQLPDVVTARISWSIDLAPWPASAAIFQPKPQQGQPPAAARSKLELAVETQAPTRAGAEPTALVSCAFTPFQLRLIGDEAFIILHFEKIEFLLAPGKKPDVNVVFREDDGIEFAGPLSFVNTLKDLIPFDGFSDPPYLDVTAEGIKAGFDIGLPTVAVGVFSLANISLGAAVRVPFIDESLDVTFNFCTRENPFRLTVWLFGGGGFFAITITPEKCRVLEAAFEFGAAVALDFGVASGSIECMAGVYFRIEDGDATLTGYFRLRGEVDVLGLISASIELYLELTYEFSSGKAVGRATLTIEVEILFLSFSVQISCEKKFKGSNDDPSFVEIMGPPPQGGDRPWDEYCRAFAA
jgi:hypothetical protein